MKTLIILLALPLFAFGQIKEIEMNKSIEIGRAAPGGVPAMTLTKVVSPGGETLNYIFRYKDYKFTRIDEWKSFEVNNSEDVEYLYQKIISGLENLPEESIMLDLSNGFVIWLEFKKIMGNNWVRISSGTLDSQIIGFSNQFNKKHINKLFGK